MKRLLWALALTLMGSSAAFATPVPEMDGGFALTTAAIVMGVGAVVYQKYFRK